MTTNKTTSHTVIRSLPEEMLSEILRHAASDSIVDFVNTRSSCKAFLQASNSDQIFENVSIEKLNLVPWRKSEKVFLQRCKTAKNVEALYRKGMIDYFSRGKPESGLRCLKRAAEKGHVEAAYAYGIILICLDGELREQGFRVLSSSLELKPNKRSSRIITSCRSKTEKFLRCMWVRCKPCNGVASAAGPNKRECRESQVNRSCSLEGQAWEASNNVGYCCENCFWDGEAILFCNLVKEYLIKIN